MLEFQQITGLNWIEVQERQVSDGYRNGTGIWGSAQVRTVYVFISTQTGCEPTDSTLSQVEGYSRMKSGVGEAGRKGALERSDGMNNWWYKLLQNSNQKSGNWELESTSTPLKHNSSYSYINSDWYTSYEPSFFFFYSVWLNSYAMHFCLMNNSSISQTVKEEKQRSR